MTTRTKVTIGVASALVAGVVIALLVAPEKSKKVGNNIRNTAGKWVDALGNIFSKAEKDVAELKNESRRLKAAIS